MSDRLSLVLALLVLLTVAADVVLLQSGAVLFVVRKLADVVEYLTFWR